MSYSVSTLLLRNLADVFGQIDPLRRRAAILPSRAMMKSVPAYSGGSPGLPDTQWTRPPSPISSGGAIG